MSAPRPARPLPALAAVARSQLRLLLRRKPRAMWITFAVVALQISLIASVGIIFGVTISSGHDQGTTVLFSRVSNFADGLEFPFDEGTAALAAVAVAAAFWAFFWPFRVWGEELLGKRGYHWTMPVDRRTHDLVRVGVGAVGLVCVVALFLLLALVVSILAGNDQLYRGFGALFWIDLLAAPPVIYLLVSIPVVGSRHPAAWLWSVLGGCALLVSLSQALELTGVSALLEGLALGPVGLLSTLGQPVVAELAAWGPYPAGRWIAGWLLWLAIGAVGVAFAAGRRPRSL